MGGISPNPNESLAFKLPNTYMQDSIAGKSAGGAVNFFWKCDTVCFWFLSFSVFFVRLVTIDICCSLPLCDRGHRNTNVRPCHQVFMFSQICGCNYFESAGRLLFEFCRIINHRLYLIILRRHFDFDKFCRSYMTFVLQLFLYGRGHMATNCLFKENQFL